MKKNEKGILQIDFATAFLIFALSSALILTMYYNSEPIFKEQVDFDDIESYHRFDDDNIIISKGKYHPIYFYDGFLSSLGFSPFNDNGDCELQCITHEKWIFYVCLFNEW